MWLLLNESKPPSLYNIDSKEEIVWTNGNVWHHYENEWYYQSKKIFSGTKKECKPFIVNLGKELGAISSNELTQRDAK